MGRVYLRLKLLGDGNSMTRHLGVPSPGPVTSTILALGTTWNPIGCNPATGVCPVGPTAGNTSVGVTLVGNFLTAITDSGLVGQGTCVNPILSKASGAFYWEAKWTELSNTFQGGIGMCSTDVIPNWSSFSSNAAGGIMLTPAGDVWFDTGIQPANFPAQSPGDTVGVFVNIQQGLSFSTTFLGVGGTVSGQQSSTFSISPHSSWVPCAVFDSVPVSNLIAVTANFGGAGIGTFLGPRVFPFLVATAGLTMGWPKS